MSKINLGEFQAQVNIEDDHHELILRQTGEGAMSIVSRDPQVVGEYESGEVYELSATRVTTKEAAVSEAELSKLSKAELIAMARGQMAEVDESLTKTELIKLIKLAS
jgi:uncharacterized protein YjlB